MEISKQLLDWVIQQRRWFHRHPEPGFHETETQKRVLEVLETLGIEHRPAAGTGVIATVRGAAAGPCFAIRADMDALRIAEPANERNAEYRSRNPEYMHACGHDGHMAMVLGCAKWLEENRSSLKGCVRLIFQPAEESLPGGAVSIIRDGGLESVAAIAGIHLLGAAPCGEFRFRPGPFLAHTCDYNLKFQGKSGHHMGPQNCIDPIAMAARFVSTIQTDIRSRLAPDTAYVLGFGTIHGGTQFNQTPDQVAMSGSFRVFDPADAATIEQALRANLDGVVEQFAGPKVDVPPRYELAVTKGYPVLVNHPGFTRRATELLRREFPQVDDAATRNLGAEDFAYYLECVPGMFTFLGAANPGMGITEINHSPRFDIDESVLGIGVRAYLSIVLDFLADPAGYLGGD